MFIYTADLRWNAICIMKPLLGVDCMHRKCSQGKLFCMQIYTCRKRSDLPEIHYSSCVCIEHKLEFYQEYNHFTIANYNIITSTADHSWEGCQYSRLHDVSTSYSTPDSTPDSKGVSSPQINSIYTYQPMNLLYHQYCYFFYCCVVNNLSPWEKCMDAW